MRLLESKENIRRCIETHFQYDLRRSVAEIRPANTFDESCQGTIPESLTVFFESHDFEHALKLAISIGGDTDTIACIVGSIAEAYYKDIPRHLAYFAWARLPSPMRRVVKNFYGRFSASHGYIPQPLAYMAWACLPSSMRGRA